MNKNDIIVVGHRGAAGLEPENTLPSVSKALEYGVDLLEIDIQRTSDNVLVVLHDETIDRTTTGEGKVGELSFKELMSVNILDLNGTETDIKVPTLGEVIQLVNGKTKLLIEVKNGSEMYPGIEEELVKMIESYDATSWCYVQSFEDDILEKVHELNPNIILHKLFYGNFLGIGLKRKSLDDYPYVSSFNTFYRLTSKSFIRKAHKQGKTVFVWTVNDESKMQKMMDKGVDGLISDRPDLVRK